MDVHQATSSYESWVRRHIPVVESDLRLKHRRMGESPFLFLRGTFYRWMQQWPEACPKLADAPRVLAVGDLHVENFGTWRDAEGRLVWGVNDVDEAYDLPYTQDLVRLATSAILAIRAEHFALTARDACDAILDGYRTSLERGGRPLVLAERFGWLRRIALNKLRDPTVFWLRLEENPTASRRASIPYRALRSMMPGRAVPERVVRRIAGMGSLGRPRFVELSRWGTALIAREAKACLPSAVVWARGIGSSKIRVGAILDGAVRVRDPFFAVRESWIVRRLAPDCTRIELGELPDRRDEAKLLRTMGWETANMHLGGAYKAIFKDLDGRKPRWLRRAADEMAQRVIADWHDWQQDHR